MSKHNVSYDECVAPPLYISKLYGSTNELICTEHNAIFRSPDGISWQKQKITGNDFFPLQGISVGDTIYTTNNGGDIYVLHNGVIKKYTHKWAKRIRFMGRINESILAVIELRAGELVRDSGLISQRGDTNITKYVIASSESGRSWEKICGWDNHRSILNNWDDGESIIMDNDQALISNSSNRWFSHDLHDVSQIFDAACRETQLLVLTDSSIISLRRKGDSFFTTGIVSISSLSLRKMLRIGDLVYIVGRRPDTEESSTINAYPISTIDSTYVLPLSRNLYIRTIIKYHDKYYALMLPNGYIYCSADGKYWERIIVMPDYICEDMIVYKGRMITVGRLPRSQYDYIMLYSDNAYEWNRAIVDDGKNVYVQ